MPSTVCRAIWAALCLTGPSAGFVQNDQRGATLGAAFGDARIDQVVDAHAVVEPDSLVFHRQIVHMVMAAEKTLGGAQLHGPVEALAGIIGAIHFLLVLTREVHHGGIALLIQLAGLGKLLQRNVEEASNLLPLAGANPKCQLLQK